MWDFFFFPTCEGCWVCVCLFLSSWHWEANEKGHVNENSLKPLGCTSQWASYIIWSRAVSAYEKYITFALIEFKAAELCFVKILPWWMIQLECMPTGWLLAWLSGCSFIQVCKRKLRGALMLKFVLKSFFSPNELNSVSLMEQEKRGDVWSRVGWGGSMEGVLGKDKWEWGMGRRALCSANGSCAFPWSGRTRLLLTAVLLHCNYLQWRDSYWEMGQKNSK